MSDDGDDDGPGDGIDDRGDDRWVRLADLIAESDGGSLGVSACQAADRALGVDRSALSLVLDHATSPIGGSDELALELDEQQFLVHDGPTVECIRGEAPVLVDDVDAARNERPGFASVAAAGGIRAAFAFPLRLGAARLGALTGYRDRAGPLSGDQYADGLVLASIVTVLLLVQQANEPPGATAEVFRNGLEVQALVQRAAGMVSEQLDLSIIDALVVIRTRAYTEGTSIRDVAERIVQRTLNLRDREEGT